MTVNRFLFAILLLSSASVACAAEDAIPLSIFTADHPHIKHIQNGHIQIPECRISYTTATLAQIKQRVELKAAGDIIEVDFVTYLQHFSSMEKHNWTLVPIFLWREFPQRHMKMKDGAIVVDVPSDSMLVWARGIASSSPTYKPPFKDSKAVEQEYFLETRIFPIISVLAVRIELVEANPWLPEAIFIAFSEAKAQALSAMTLPFPWGEKYRDETVELMKENFWSYGVKNNPKSLSTLFKYAHEQGFTKEELSPEDVFSNETILLIDEKGAKN